jgi:hypothetical protein
VHDYEGSQSELLRFLAEFGEEPAFLARARAPQLALDALLHHCEAKRDELLEWPRFHLAVLAQQIRGDWARLGYLLAAPESATMLAALHARMPAKKPVAANRLVSDKAALARFLESAERFNRHWRTYLNGLDLEPVNRPRRDFNQYYPLEKACAFGNERVTDGFEPLAMIDHTYLFERFALLTIPGRA